MTQLPAAPIRSHGLTATVFKSGTMKSRIIGTPSYSAHCSNAVFPVYGLGSNILSPVTIEDFLPLVELCREARVEELRHIDLLEARIAPLGQSERLLDDLVGYTCICDDVLRPDVIGGLGDPPVVET